MSHTTTRTHSDHTQLFFTRGRAAAAKWSGDGPSRNHGRLNSYPKRRAAGYRDQSVSELGQDADVGAFATRRWILNDVFAIHRRSTVRR
jgi:hypothetical protein